MSSDISLDTDSITVTGKTKFSNAITVDGGQDQAVSVTSNSTNAAVYGYNTNRNPGGPGVHGSTKNATNGQPPFSPAPGVYGEGQITGVKGIGIDGVHGEGFTHGVLGIGTGPGIMPGGNGEPTYLSGIGVRGESTSSDGVQGESPSSGFSGVWGDNSGNGYGVSGSSTAGVGGWFRGGSAPLLLGPSSTSGAPTTGNHQMGELFVDNTGTLYFCIAGGTPGTWKKVQLV